MIRLQSLIRGFRRVTLALARGFRRLRRTGRGTRITGRTGDSFLTGVDRRLHAPLGTVLNFARLLTHRPSLAPRRTSLRLVQSDNRRLLSLVGSILSLTGVRTKHVDLCRGIFGLASLIGGLRRIFQLQTDGGQLLFCVGHRRSVPAFIRTSRHGLHRILVGLLGGTVGFARTKRIILRVRTIPPLSLPRTSPDTDPPTTTSPSPY